MAACRDEGRRPRAGWEWAARVPRRDGHSPRRPARVSLDGDGGV